MSLSQDQRYYMKLKALSYLYEDGLTQTEIAKRLSISRVTLGKLLEEARAEGMIKFEIVDVRGNMRVVQLEKELCEKFGLRDVRLVDAGTTDEEQLALRIATEGAAYVGPLIESGQKIGVTWGRTLSNMIAALSPDPRIRDLEIYTLVGGASMSSNFQPNLLAERLLNKYDGQTFVITAPFMCQTEKLCANLKQEPAIARILDASHSLDLTLVGLGEEPQKGADHLSDYPFDKKVIQELVKAKAVGDICGNFFDIHGKLCDTSLRRRIVSIDITDLPKHKTVVALGGGPKKMRSLLGALHGGYLDVLISDVHTAEMILRD